MAVTTKTAVGAVGKIPVISVVVAVLNGASTLQHCINSFTGQTYKHKELIIIDGGSTDGTIEVLEKNQDKIAYWESVPDRGISHAWNKGVNKTTGNWIIFLGADDVLYNPQVLENFVQTVKKIGKSKRILYGKVAMSNSGVIDKIVGWSWETIKYSFLNIENKIPHQGIFHARDLFTEFGMFDENLKITSDYDFLLRCIIRGITPYFINNLIVTKMQKGGLSNSLKTTIFTYLEFSKSRKINNYKVYSVQYLWLLCKGCIKYVVGRGNEILKNYDE